jgi:hypothetical protein
VQKFEKEKTLKFGTCRKSGKHQKEYLAKSGYKPEIKYKSLIILLFVWGHNESQIQESGDSYFLFFSPLLGTETSKISVSFRNVIFNFCFWQNFTSKNKAASD